MDIQFVNRSPVSRLKLNVIQKARGLKNLVPNHSNKSWASWSVERIDAPADSERCVEIPWVASAISNCFGLWLDIGYAHAEYRYWEAIDMGPSRFLRYGYGLDISPPKGPNPLPVHIVGDLITDSLEQLPKFDLITCISTLEHIGCDNTVYLAEAKRSAKSPAEIQRGVLRKLLDQLASRGRLLVSVPYGQHQDHGWFLQYDEAMLTPLKNVATSSGRRLISERYYMAEPQGWRKCRPDEMREVRYQPEQKRAAGVVLLEFSG